MSKRKNPDKNRRGINRPKNRPAYGRRPVESPAERPTPVAPVREHTNLRVKAALAGVFLAGFGVVYFYAKPEGKQPDKTTQAQTADPVTEDTLIVDLPNRQKSIPDIKLADVEAEFGPTQLAPLLSPEEMKEISKKVAEFARNYFIKNTMPDLGRAIEDIDRTRRASADFINAVMQFIIALGPEVGRPLMSIGPETPANIKARLYWVFINNFLLQQNLMLTEQTLFMGGHAFYNLSPVEKFQNAVITDPETAERTLVPIIYLKDTLLPQEEIPLQFRNTSIKYDPDTGMIFWRNGELARMLKQPAIVDEIRRYLPDYPGAAELHVDDFEPILKHESAHKFIGEKYPQDLSRQNDARDYVDAAVNLGNGETLRIKGAFHPVSFHELAANGVELASTTEKDLLVEKSLLHSKFSKEAPETYALIRLFLEKAFDDGGANPEKTALNSSVEAVNAAGRQMYSLGMILLENRKKIR